MCRAVTCKKCGKTTWAGCGQHVDQVLARVPRADRCAGHPLNLDRAVLLLAGTLTVLSALLVALVSPWWLLLTAFVGLNLLQSSITGFCPAAVIFRRLGVSNGCAFR